MLVFLFLIQNHPDGVADSVGVGGSSVLVGVDDGTSVVAVLVAVLVAVSVGVGVLVPVDVAVSVGVGVEEGVGVAENSIFGVAVFVFVGVRV